MDDATRREVEAAGFRVGTVREFLGLTDAEAEEVEFRVAAGRRMSDHRRRLRKTISDHREKIRAIRRDENYRGLDTDLAGFPVELREVVRDMVAIMRDPEATDDERSMSFATIADAIRPPGPPATFAGWIPEVLAELESLGSLPRHPSPATIQRARSLVVNEPANRARPQVTSDACPDGDIAITVKWPSRTIGGTKLHDYILVYPGGDIIVSTS